MCFSKKDVIHVKMHVVKDDDYSAPTSYNISRGESCYDWQFM